MDILIQFFFDIDEIRIYYIQDVFSFVFVIFGKRREFIGVIIRGGRIFSDGFLGSIEDDSKGISNIFIYLSIDKINEDLMGVCVLVKIGVELDFMIVVVKDLLFDLGDGFIELCLEEVEYDVEKVINFVLEDKLLLFL